MRGAIAAIALACLTLACLTVSSATPCQAQGVAGFELLDLDGARVAWKSRTADGALRITYAITPRPVLFPGARNCGALAPIDGLLDRSHLERAAFEAEVRAAFDLWQRAADIEFIATVDLEHADILIGAQGRPIGRAFTNVAYNKEDGAVRSIERSLICFNPDRAWKIGFDGNLDAYDLRYTMAHEIGHAIGLDHPSASGQLMSFRYEELFRALQPGDLKGVANIYGARAHATQ